MTTDPAAPGSGRDDAAIRLRKYPYPYRAAFTVCNDIDGTTFRDFALIHDFLNGAGATPLGPGLGLSLADSLWFYSHAGTPDHAFSYFDHAGRPGPHAPILRELIQSGWIDTLHSYGNFSQFGGFSRDLAQRCLEEMARCDLDLAVWVNHGDEHNAQNIGPAAHHRGDKPEGAGASGGEHGNPHYHSDLLAQAGFRYFWDSESALTRIVGQNRPCSRREALLHDLMSPAIVDHARRLAFAGRRALRGFGRGGGAQSEAGRRSAAGWSPAADNALLEPVALGDGRPMIRFMRLGSGRHDWSDDLAFLIREAVLDRLAAVEGASILYVHWGDRKDRAQALPFTPAAAAAFVRLADRSRAGEIWVPGTRMLLDYVWTWQNLSWQAGREGDGWIIEVARGGGKDTPGAAAPATAALGVGPPPGLTFYCPEPEKTRLLHGGEPVEVRVNPRDHTGQPSLSVPLKTPDYPFKLHKLRLAN